MANGIPLPKEGKKKKKNIKTWRKEADTAMQIKGRELFPRSLISAQPTEVMHHFIPKSVSSRLRYEWDNLIPLTNAEHCRLHQSEDPAIEQAIRTIKGDAWWNKLCEMRKENVKLSIGYYKNIVETILKDTRYDH